MHEVVNHWQAKPEARKLVIGTTALLIASVSGILVVGILCNSFPFFSIFENSASIFTSAYC